MQVIFIHEFTHLEEVQIQSSDSYAHLDLTFFIASKLNPDNVLLERIFPLLPILNLQSVLNHIELQYHQTLPDHLVIVIHNMEDIMVIGFFGHYICLVLNNIFHFCFHKLLFCKKICG